MTLPYIPLGESGWHLSSPVEEPFFWLETEPGSGVFEWVCWAAAKFEILTGANGLPTAEFGATLGDEGLYWDWPPGEDLSDWQVRGLGGTADSPDEAILGGRRIQIRTNRGFGQGEDWILFEGFVTKLRLGFSGSSPRQVRWLKGLAVSTLAAADLEPSQQLGGQWRRTRRCQCGLLKGTWNQPDVCCRTPVPLIFNPDGKPNCDPRPLYLADARGYGQTTNSRVFIPCDTGPSAEFFTVARILRYVEWCGYQPPAPDPGGTPATYYDVPCLSRPEGLTQLANQWTSWGLRHANLDQLLATPWNGTSILECTADTGAPAFGIRSLLRAPRSLALPGSVLEGFVAVAQKAGLFVDSFHQVAPGGAALTFLKFSVRGHVMPPAGPWPKPMPAPLPAESEAELAR